MAKRQPISVGVVGLGRSGWDIHVRGIRDDPRYRIVAAVDMQADRRREAERELGCATFEDFAPMLKQTDAELIVVASPSHMHAKQTIAAFKAGRHVSVEKPVAQTAREFDRMVAAATQAKKQLFVHHNYRWMRSFTFMQDVLKSKKLGKLFHLGWLVHGFGRRSDWQCLQAHGGGLLNNHGTHLLDQILMLMGAPVVDVLSDMKHISDAGDCEDHIKMMVRAENGVTADLELSTAAATPLGHITFLGANGSMIIQGGRAHLKYFDPRKIRPLKLKKTLAAAGREYATDRSLPWVEEHLPVEGPDIGTFYDAVIDTIRNRKKFPVNPDQVRHVLNVIEICRKQNPEFPGR